jgi:hypothetical protein
MELVMQKPYALSYAPGPIPTIYSGYTAQIATSPFRDSNIEKVTITIKHNTKEVSILEAYKENH